VIRQRLKRLAKDVPKDSASVDAAYAQTPLLIQRAVVVIFFAFELGTLLALLQVAPRSVDASVAFAWVISLRPTPALLHVLLQTLT
jgi:ABC-type amino acid transport system permease subunit